MSNTASTTILLEQCRRNFGAAPRHFGTRDYFTYLHSSPPLWSLLGDDLRQFFRRQKELLETGAVVWGHLVQANRLLFQNAPHNHPGEVVYCTDPSREVTPTELGPIARQLFQLKGARVGDREQQYIGDYLADEFQRVFGLPVPSSISPSFPCAISTVFFNRKHLPDRKLSNSFFPLVISREQPRIAAVLPSRYWPELLQRRWHTLS